MKIYSVNDKKFRKYGQVIDNPFLSDFENAQKSIAVPESGSAYLPSVESFETEKLMDYYGKFFGEMGVQIGYCWGRNNTLNALEWHKSTEINIALEDMILLLGDMREMDGNVFNTGKVKAFLVKKGQAVEIYQTTLHFCPCAKNEQVFKSVVILPRGTNTPLEQASEDKRLIAKNKWLICHPECKRHVDLGRVATLKGKNIVVK